MGEFSRIRAKGVVERLDDYNIGNKGWFVAELITRQAKQMFYQYRQHLLDCIRRENYSLEEVVSKLVSSDSFLWWTNEYLPSDKQILTGMFDYDEETWQEHDRILEELGVEPRKPIPFSER